MSRRSLSFREEKTTQKLFFARNNKKAEQPGASLGLLLFR